MAETDERRASETAANFTDENLAHDALYLEVLRAQRLAREDEREQCAKICDEHIECKELCEPCTMAEQLARNIRARRGEMSQRKCEVCAHKWRSKFGGDVVLACPDCGISGFHAADGCNYCRVVRPVYQEKGMTCPSCGTHGAAQPVERKGQP